MWRKILFAGLGIFSIFSAAVIGSLAMNRPMLLSPPGPVPRLIHYLRYNTAETSDRPMLPELQQRRYGIPAEEIIDQIEPAIEDLPRWGLVKKEPSVGVFSATVRSRLLGYRDDLSIMVIDGPDGVTDVYLHSASRIGRGDLGANRAHILEFYEALERRLVSAE